MIVNSASLKVGKYLCDFLTFLEEPVFEQKLNQLMRTLNDIGIKMIFFSKLSI